MAKIIWTEKFHQELDSCLEYASIEFGKSTVKKWADEIAKFEHRASLFPTSYTPESLLEGKEFLYRSRHVMSRRFKLIFYYDEAEDVETNPEPEDGNEPTILDKWKQWLNNLMSTVTE